MDNIAPCGSNKSSVKVLFKIYLSFIIFLFCNASVAAEKQMVLGAGPSTAVVSLFFKTFPKDNFTNSYVFKVDARSIKHAGGIKASDNYLFGRTGRPLNHAEKAKNKGEILLARIPIAIVVGHKAGVDSITLEQLEGIITGKITNWSQLDGPDKNILLVGRESTEAVLGVLKNRYPFFARARFTKTLQRDHQVANLLEAKSGDYALSFGAAPNFESYHHLAIAGFDAGVNLGLVYDLSNQDHPVVRAVAEYAKTRAWLNILDFHHYLPPAGLSLPNEQN